MSEVIMPDVTCCIGCGLRCEARQRKTFDSLLCDNAKIVVWPEDNLFFIATLNNLIFKKMECTLPEGIIFVDFCIDNILYFLNDDWLEKLTGFRMRIVLISDRKMKAMAKYWLNKTRGIHTVLVAGNGKNQFVHDMQQILCGKKYNPGSITAMTENEMQVLRMMTRGLSVRDIAEILNCSTKSVYNYQYSLCKKFGGLTRLEDLCRKHRVS